MEINERALVPTKVFSKIKCQLVMPSQLPLFHSPAHPSPLTLPYVLIFEDKS